LILDFAESYWFGNKLFN